MSDDLGTGPRDAIASLVLAARLDGHPICLDSGPLIDYLARQRPVTDLLDPLLLDPAVPVVISTITLAEVLGRPALAGDTAVVGAIRRALLALPAFRIVDLDQAHAVETALVRAGLASSCPTPRSLPPPTSPTRAPCWATTGSGAPSPSASPTTTSTTCSRCRHDPAVCRRRHARAGTPRSRGWCRRLRPRCVRPHAFPARELPQPRRVLPHLKALLP